MDSEGFHFCPQNTPAPEDVVIAIDYQAIEIILFLQSNIHTWNQDKDKHTYYLQAGHSRVGPSPSVDTILPSGRSLPAAASETSVHLSDTLTAAPPVIHIFRLSQNAETHLQSNLYPKSHMSKFYVGLQPGLSRSLYLFLLLLYL